MNKLINKLPDLLFLLSILFFTVGLNLQDNPPGGWYQQFLPDLSGTQISDITFIDSLIGYAVTPFVSQYDTAYIIKTTNGGENWFVLRTDTEQWNGFSRVIFLNKDTGYVSGNHGIERTTNGGQNWISLNFPILSDPVDMFVLNKDTIWFTDDHATFGGLFRTTNGGTTWTVQIQWAGTNPDKIYMYNRNLGFLKRSTALYRTTNGGFNWTEINSYGFLDILLTDSLNGWKASGLYFYKTSDGGINWIQKPLPPEGGIIQNSLVNRFSNVNEDTLWGVGSLAFFGGGVARGLIYKSTNGGESWGYQLPDTSINIPRYYFTKFVNELNGWAYYYYSGVHTVTGGGDTTIYVGVKQVNNEIPEGFKLFQNYPNPFNNETIINYELKNYGEIIISMYDVSGKLIKVLVKDKQVAGSYEYRFNGAGSPSGVYFYRLVVDGNLIDTNNIILIK